MVQKKELQEVLTAYGLEERVACIQAYGNGHINDTELVTYRDEVNEEELHKLILQKINTGIFKEPASLMENVTKVTEWIGKKVKEKGGNIEREVLLVVPTKAGRSYYTSKEGNCYRAYVFIENGLCLDAPRTKEDLFESGMAFGGFQGALADFPAEELHETIPDFHNTVGH